MFEKNKQIKKLIYKTIKMEILEFFNKLTGVGFFSFPEINFKTLEIIFWTFMSSWIISRFEPLQWLLNYLPNNKIKFLLQTLTGCIKCVSLYMGIIISGNIFLPTFSSFIAMLYDKTIGGWETKIKFK